MTSLPKLTGTLLGLGLAALSFSHSTISQNCIQAYHKAIDEANHGQSSRALATLNCLIMPKGVTVGLGRSGAMAKAVDRSVAVWADRLEDSPFVFSGIAEPDLKVVFVSSIAKGGDVQGEVHCQRQVYWSTAGSRYRVKGTILIRDNVDGRRITSTEASSVIEHELGHVLGLEDDDDANHLMGPFVAGQPVNGPSEEEVRIVARFRNALQDVVRQVNVNGTQLNSRGTGHRGHRISYHSKP